MRIWIVLRCEIPSTCTPGPARDQPASGVVGAGPLAGQGRAGCIGTSTSDGPDRAGSTVTCISGPARAVPELPSLEIILSRPELGQRYLCPYPRSGPGWAESQAQSCSFFVVFLLSARGGHLKQFLGLYVRTGGFSKQYLKQYLKMYFLGTANMHLGGSNYTT